MIGNQRLSIIISCIVVVLLGGNWAHSKNIYVPIDYNTIQSAIDASVNGDIVIVAPGTYAGADNKNLNYTGKAITVTSTDGPEKTIIDCESNGRGVLFVSGEGRNAVFKGFTIRNGNVNGGSLYGGKGGGIFSYNSSPTISDTIIEDCVAEGFGGGGIMLNSSGALIQNTIIRRNVADICGGGIYLESSPEAKIYNSIVTSNRTSGYPSMERSSGGGICLVNSSAQLSRLTISYNDADTSYAYSSDSDVTNSGGISFREGSNGTLDSSIISHNKAQERGGIGGWSASPTITNCLVENNEATVVGGGGIGLYNDSLATIKKTTIRNNYAPEYGGGISIWNPSVPVGQYIFEDLLIEDNRAGDTGGGINALDAAIKLVRSIVRNNEAPKKGGIHIKATDPTTAETDSQIENCLIVNNVGTSAEGGGLALVTGANATVLNTTITNNSHPSSSNGGIYNWQSALTVANSIIWGNTSSGIIDGATITYSNLGYSLSGNGNMSVDPQFTSDFHLQAGSPCIDAGSNSEASSLLLDLGGNPRVNGTVDMGAYEFPATSGGPGASGSIGASVDFSNYNGPPAESGSAINPTLYLLLQKGTP